MTSLKRAFWKSVWFGMISTILVSYVAHAGWEYEYSEGKKVKIGADIRLRLTHWDDDVLFMGANPATVDTPYEYLRNRTRIWANVDVTDDIQFNARLVNRFHHFSSRPGDNNTGAGTWQFPDEVIVDQLNFKISNFLTDGLTLTLGRQDMILGNGMIMLEGTPYDQGRTIYFDGISARYQTERDTITAFVFYNDYKDKTVFINDQNRPLRGGDIFTTGLYWTHKINSTFNTDLYYIYADVDDDRDDFTDQPNHNADQNAVLHTYGGRLFGDLTESVGYSMEVALEDGEDAGTADFSGMFADARLSFKLGNDVPLKPVLNLEYTFFSGDDPDSADEYEGWEPLFAEYPIWREELIPITLWGRYSNMSQYRSELVLQLAQNVKLTTAYAYLQAQNGDLPIFTAPNANGQVGTYGGDGESMGHLVSGFLDIVVNKHLNFSLEAATFYPGNYWGDEGQTCDWFRFQAIYSF